jgi:hypothetical protein
MEEIMKLIGQLEDRLIQDGSASNKAEAREVAINLINSYRLAKSAEKSLLN